MHNSSVLFRQLAPLLAARLAGHRLVSCFSQERDEVVMEFNNGEDSLFIKAVFGPSLTCLTFPAGFRRARKNSAELFGEVILQQVREVRAFRHERSLLIALDGGYGLLFKMHGPSGNLILIANDRPVALFRNRLTADRNINVKQLDRDLDQTRKAFEENCDSLRTLYFTFGREVWTWLEDQGFAVSDDVGKWGLICQVFEWLDKSMPEYLVIRSQHRIFLSVLPFGEVVARHFDPVKALNEFYAISVRDAALLNTRLRVVRRLEQLIRQTEVFSGRSQKRLDEITADHHFQIWADLLMANLHQVPVGAKEWAGESFYSPGTWVTIRLNPALSPQKNAEVYYRKSRNRNSEITMLNEVIKARTGILKRYREMMDEAGVTEDIRLLIEIEAALPKKQDTEVQDERIPFAEYEFMGFRILVGRSSEDNDELTFRYGTRNDLWLHARDCPGSHVLIKARPGMNFPKPVLERAAALAAFYSKRKGESLCPVSYTERKFVRKRKGDPPGMVIMDRESVIMIEPSA